MPCVVGNRVRSWRCWLSDIIPGDQHVSPPHTRLLTLASICLMRTLHDNYIPDQRRPSNFTNCSSIMKQELTIASYWRRPTHAEYWNRATAIRMQKTDLKVGFQAIIWNSTHAMHPHEKCRKSQCAQRIESTRLHALFFACVHCIFRFFDCIASRVTVCVACVGYDNLETAC